MAGTLATLSFGLITQKLHTSEVYKGFHSTSPNFTLPPKIACVCDKSHPSAEEGCLTVWFPLEAVCFSFPFGRVEALMRYWRPASFHSLSHTGVN